MICIFNCLAVYLIFDKNVHWIFITGRIIWFEWDRSWHHAIFIWFHRLIIQSILRMLLFLIYVRQRFWSNKSFLRFNLLTHWTYLLLSFMPLKINWKLPYAFVPPIFLLISIAIRRRYEISVDRLLIHRWII